MDEPSKKPNFVQRLLLGSRRRSVHVVEPSKLGRSSEAVLESASKKEGAEKEREKEKEKEERKPEEVKPLVRARSGTAGTLLSRSSSRMDPVAAADESYERNPTCVEDLPRVLVSPYLVDIATPRESMNANFDLTLRVLRLTVKKEHRHFSFLRAKGVTGTTDDAEPVSSVFSEVPTEKAVRRRYKVGDEIGKGAFGNVYEGKYEGKAVALKKISNIGDRASLRNRQEAFYLSKCQHDKILRVYACLHALDTNTVWLVMELIKGGSLDEALSMAGPLPENEAASVAKDLLQALAYLHERGFAHRDVKPANAMLSLEEQKRASVKLVDFSLCHDTRLGSPPVHAVGTVMFMPPEMIAREPHDVLCDIWSLGITAVYLLTGRGPWKSAFDSLFLPASETSLPKLKVGFSDAAGAFVASACSPKSLRPSAEELLKHEWIAGAAPPDEMWRLVKTVFRHNCINNVIGGM